MRPLSSRAVQVLHASFLEWSGGDPPSSLAQIRQYTRHTMPASMNEGQVRGNLTEWMQLVQEVAEETVRLAAIPPEHALLWACLARALKTAKPAEHPPIRGYDRERGRHEQWDVDCRAVARALLDDHPVSFNVGRFLSECGVQP